MIYGGNTVNEVEVLCSDETRKGNRKLEFG
jgi:hypothetical protein